jgi:outer membrane lipoprotein carrier protein
VKNLLISLSIFASIVSFPVYAQTSVGHLKRFLTEVKTYSADFDQVVLDENLRQIDEAGGTLTIMRPGRFRWDYYPPAEQQIIGDGEKVWIYDLELKQVIVRDQLTSLGNTPAILLAGESVKLNQYKLEDRGQQGAVQWVKVIPHVDASGFDDIQVGFIDSALSVMVLVDGLGQTTRINFKNGLENAPLPVEQFTFIPPDDADVIDETQ